MIDIDEGETLESVTNKLKSKTINHILITSKSHIPTHHKFHIILPLDYPIYSKESYQSLLKSTVIELDLNADKACYDWARFFYGSPDDALYYSYFDGNNLLCDKNISY